MPCNDQPKALWEIGLLRTIPETDSSSGMNCRAACPMTRWYNRIGEVGTEEPPKETASSWGLSGMEFSQFENQLSPQTP